ncbi:hypothetical protein SKTS_27000 [Sulfurimicrobium lacus]|uniref:Uncharacterized protein n=1 Tax=Sulfurimicrobium lacus TaxID=2715678 RepID=A0A6F8VDR1_9PROT|nr:hypothetical protein [Sulfurimicrobium lacus]BCB27814.1 hypothetical protein SKTS_27000 [Sulfurimicrobium lacus]
MIDNIHPQATQSMYHGALQSEAITRNGRRIFVVPDSRDQEWRWTVGLMRVKTAYNYWRNGYRWRASWILAQR